MRVAVFAGPFRSFRAILGGFMLLTALILTRQVDKEYKEI